MTIASNRVLPAWADDLRRRVREKADSGTRFSVARRGDRISQVVSWSGEGRERKEHRISLTDPQGLFLYHLPFPGAEPLAIADILPLQKSSACSFRALPDFGLIIPYSPS